MSAKIFAVGAGKGGVGKTFIASSLAITLAKLNHSVLIIDFDLSGSNVHTNLGMSPCNPTIQSFINEQSNLSSLVQATPIPHLSLIQGVWEEWEHSLCAKGKGLRLVQEARKLSYDYIVIDLGPGSTATNLEIFQAVDEKILITSAEPTSLEKSYRFLEAWILNQISVNISGESFTALKESVKSFRAQKNTGHFSLKQFLSTTGGISLDQFQGLNEKPIHILVNSCRTHIDQNLGFSIKSVCNKFFDLPIDYIGYVDFDNAVWHSIRNREPFLIAKPFTALSGQFLSLAKSLSTDENNYLNGFRGVI